MLTVDGDKQIAIGETGILPTSNILMRQPRWVWFLGWAEWSKTHNDPDTIRDLYSSCLVINQGLEAEDCSVRMPIAENFSAQ